MEGNTPVSSNDWETIKAGGDESVQRWVDKNFKYKQCVIVLDGKETSSRSWVIYGPPRSAAPDTGTLIPAIALILKATLTPIPFPMNYWRNGTGADISLTNRKT